MKIRNPFLAMERGIAANITRTLPQGEPSKSWASTMVVTNKIRLERMLLHSSATSSVSPGIVSRRPSCVTGTPAIAKSRLAAYAELCCKKLTMWFNANSGRGTNHNKKHRGKTQTREIRVPKQQTND